jgi:GDPmannose 4,6-dehydratase
MMKKKAVITGITGQDGSYLAELLLDKEYDVIGMARRSSSSNFERIKHLENKITIEYGDLADQTSINRILDKYKPNEVYNLAAQSFVKTSFDQPILTSDITGIGVTRVLESIKTICPKAKFYQASSSEMFGKVQTTPQDENTKFYPRSPYGTAKAYAHHMTVNYRESYNMFACSGILFNHESPRRGKEFVTQKIINGAVSIKNQKSKNINLGNLEAIRDWGYAKDYCVAMWLMLQQDEPDDYVIGTGKTNSVKDFCDISFKLLNLNYEEHVVVDENYFRPAEVDLLVADASKAKLKLGWEPKTNLEELIKIMIESEKRKQFYNCFLFSD